MIFCGSRPKAWRSAAPRAVAPRGELGEIRVGLGSCCVAQGSGQVHRAIEDVLAQTGAPAVVKRVGCVGMCHQTPLVELIPPNGGPRQLFAKVGQHDAADIVLKHFKPRGVLRAAGYRASRWLDRLLTDEIGDPVARHAIDVRDAPVCAFLGPQMHLATEYCGQFDPIDLDEYLRHDGFVALRHCLEHALARADHRHGQAKRAPRPRRGRLSHRAEVGQGPRRRGRRTNTSSATATRATPAHSWTACCWSRSPTALSRECASPPKRSAPHEGFFYIRAEYPLAVGAHQRSARALPRSAGCWATR